MPKGEPKAFKLIVTFLFSLSIFCGSVSSFENSTDEFEFDFSEPNEFFKQKSEIELNEDPERVQFVVLKLRTLLKCR